MALSCVRPPTLTQLTEGSNPEYKFVLYGTFERRDESSWNVELEYVWRWGSSKAIFDTIVVKDSLASSGWPTNIEDGTQMWFAANEMENNSLSISACSAMGQDVSQALLERAEPLQESRPNFLATIFAFLLRIFA